ncbi:MAG: pyrimidine dimer DNA glycosylase/endonuclease V [Candidatus Sigynarchaeota archaeon]
MTSFDMEECARHLDSRRLGKQRVEALQILRANLGLSKGWKNHPVTRAWKGYEPFLLNIYLKAIMDEWERRGYKNVKCITMRDEIAQIIGDAMPVPPPWLTEQLILSHQSNLVRKNPVHYKCLFPGIPDDIPYAWPRSPSSKHTEKP